MAIGYPKNKTSLDNVVGGLAQEIHRSFRRASQLKTELDTFTDQQLVNAGYSSAEVTTLRTMATDLEQLRRIYEGVDNLALAKDFRVSLRPMWGILGDH